MEAAVASVTLPFEPRAGERVYEGVRPERSSQPPTIYVNGQPFPLVYAAATGFIPADFEWGYLGRGPDALGRALVYYETGLPLPIRPETRPPTLAERCITRMYAAAGIFTATFPRNITSIEWTLDTTQLTLWMKLIVLLVSTTPADQHIPIREPGMRPD